MQNFWRRPFAFIEQMERLANSGYIKRPAYLDIMLIEKPSQDHSVQSNLPRSRKIFREDVWRKWYYSKYPQDKRTWAYELRPGEGRFFKTPVDQFVERMGLLVDKGKKSQHDAFRLAVVEKEFKEQTAILEAQTSHDQAVHLFNLPEALWRERALGSQETAFLSAKDALVRDRIGKISYLITLKQDAGEETKIKASQLQGLSREQILKFIDDHPGSAKYFHESLFSRELAKAMAKLRKAPTQLAIPGKIGERGQLQDFEAGDVSDAEIAAERTLAKMTSELNLDLEADPRMARMNTTQRLLYTARVYYEKVLDQTMREYLRGVLSPGSTEGAKEALSKQTIDTEIDRLFADFNESIQKTSLGGR